MSTEGKCSNYTWIINPPSESSCVNNTMHFIISCIYFMHHLYFFTIFIIHVFDVYCIFWITSSSYSLSKYIYGVFYGVCFMLRMEYSMWIRSILVLLLPWLPVSPGHQQLSYCLARYVGPCLPCGRISTTCAISIWRNERNAKHIIVKSLI